MKYCYRRFPLDSITLCDDRRKCSLFTRLFCMA